MFKIRTTAKGYVAELQSSGDRYFCGHVQKTEGYPSKAKFPYKADVSLMKPKQSNPKECDFIRLSRQDTAARTIISALMPELCAHIKREKDLEETIKQEEKEQFDLLESSLDDLEELN